MKQRENLKLLLLQIRDCQDLLKQEYDIFVKYLQVAPQQVDTLNTLQNPHFDRQIIEGYDALLVGGASEVSVVEPERYSFIESAKGLLLYCLQRDIPVFASCFGFQLAVLALGGKITSDNGNDFDMGSIQISLTKHAADDLLLHDTPDKFLAVAVHNDKAVDLPGNCRLLAETDRCCYAFRVDNKPFWAFQFHPEVDKEILIKRLTTVKKIYTKGSDHFERVLANAVDTPESNRLCSKFIERVLLNSSSPQY